MTEADTAPTRATVPPLRFVRVKSANPFDYLTELQRHSEELKRRPSEWMPEALDLTTPAGRAMAGLLAVFAEFEREILRERVRAGLVYARQNGKRLGRPATAAIHSKQVRQLFRAGISKSEIARRLRIGRTSVRRILG